MEGDGGHLTESAPWGAPGMGPGGLPAAGGGWGTGGLPAEVGGLSLLVLRAFGGRDEGRENVRCTRSIFLPHVIKTPG